MKKNISVIESLDFSLGTVDVKESKKLSALRNHYIREVKDFGIDKIYFSGEYPSVYFKKVKNFEIESRNEILAIHKKIWNQGKVPFIYVESSSEIRIYNCYEKPVEPNQKDRQIEDLELYKTALDDLTELKQVFGKVAIETGNFWKEKKYAERVKNEFRVEQELIKNLKKTREVLEKDLSIPLIHNLLLRSLFILYLEDRKATDEAFYKKITGLKTGTSYFEILKSKKGSYKLFEELDDRFNGNLSPVTNEEKQLVTEQHLLLIRDCFWAEIRRGDGQMRLFEDWRLFNFEIIPIQLLSEIYEEFLGAEDPKGKAKAGAFYTPHPLAEFVLNEVLPYSNSKKTKYNIKTLDPTCGSGIFLVETLNRLLDRWEIAHPKEQMTFDRICEIVKENIFGIEINKEAIKVAAFSIYLAMLNRLNPKKLWQNKRFPYLIYDPEEEDERKQGENLFRMSSLEKEPFDDVELVVGNPPFKRGGLKKEEQDYLDKRGYARELVLAFLDRVTVLAPNAKYGLICGSKPVLFNNGEPYQKFRKFLFNETYVDKVFNFSILRRGSKNEGGRNLFASAVSPISVVFYSKKFPKNPSEKIMYCAPKTAIKNRIIDGIAIDKTDVKYLPRIECQDSKTKIWKTAMWGTERDFLIIQNFFFQTPSILDFLEKNGWPKGRGFQISKPTPNEILEIKKLPHIPAKTLTRYYTDKINTVSINFTKFERTGNIYAYQSPHLLIKEGQKNKKFCSSFLDYSCSYRDTIYGIHSSDSNKLKLLMAFLNSNLATYIMFLVASDWGIERERVKPNEILRLPNLSFSIEKKIQKHLINLIDKIIQTKKNYPLDEVSITEKFEKEIETTFWNALNLSKVEKILIEDFHKYTLDAFQNKKKSIAYYPNQLKENKLYAKYLCQTINEFLDYDEDLTVWSSVFELSRHVPLNVVVLYFNKNEKADTIQELPEKKIGQVLKEMEEYSYKEYAESIYYRRFFRYAKGDKLYIIKPNEKRFWSRSMAINDADEVIAEVLNQ